MTFLLTVLAGILSLGVGGGAYLLSRGVLGKRLERPARPRDPSFQSSPSLILLAVPVLALSFLILLGPWPALAVSLLLVPLLRTPVQAAAASIRKAKIVSKIREVFPSALEMIIQALRTGQTVSQALAYTAQEGASPLKEEMILVCSEMSLGSSVESALDHLQGRWPEIKEFSDLLQAYRISRTTGANLGHLLQLMGEGIEEKNRLLRKMDAMTAQARLSGLLMGLLPFFLGFSIFLMDPGLMLPLFTEKAGWGILGLSLFLETIGFFWIRRLLHLEV